MKKFFYVKILISFLFMIFLTLTGCTKENYTCELFASNDADFTDNENSKINSITINNNVYELEYEKSRATVYNDEQIDIYIAISGVGVTDIGAPPVFLDANNNVQSFYGITPYPMINNYENLSDNEIKSAVEYLLSAEHDFTKYNDFSIDKNESTHSCSLLWRVKHEYVLDIQLRVMIDKNGFIILMDESAHCRENYKEPFLSNSERDKLISAELHNKLKINIFENINYTIDSEILSMRHGKDAITYFVNVEIADGFYELYGIVISKEN